MKYLVTQFLFVLLLGVIVNAQIFTETFDYNEGALMDVTNLNVTSPYYPVAQNNVSSGV